MFRSPSILIHKGTLDHRGSIFGRVVNDMLFSDLGFDQDRLEEVCQRAEAAGGHLGLQNIDTLNEVIALAQRDTRNT